MAFHLQLGVFTQAQKTNEIFKLRCSVEPANQETIDNPNACVGVRHTGVAPFSGDMSEIMLLIPSSMATCLEMLANQEGITVAVLVRHLIRQHIEKYLNSFGDDSSVFTKAFEE